MSTEQNKAIVRRYLDEVVNKGNYDVIDELMDANYVNPTTTAGREPGGAERYKSGVAGTRAAFPDIEVTVEDMVAEGDMVAYQSTWRGTHLGVFRDISPTGRCVEWKATCFRRVRGGKVVEGWGTYDWLGVLEQLGASVTPPSA